MKRNPCALYRVPFLVILMVLSFAPLARSADVIQTSGGELRITPIGHGSLMLEFGGKTIHVDPASRGGGDFTGLSKADLILLFQIRELVISQMPVRVK